jgi:DNA-binding NarL/FixJ family response regulator
MKSPGVRILLADNQDIVRTGLRTLLEARQNWQVCCEASNGKEAVRLAAEMRPDIAVLELDMNEVDGVSATRQIRRLHPKIEVLIFTMQDDEDEIREVLAAGARAFVLKSEGGGKLIQAIESALEHKPFLASRAAETLLNSFLLTDSGHSPASPLTKRQREIVQLLANGRSNKEVAAALSISIKTVETHRAAIMRKLGFRSIANLVRYAVRERVIKA